MEGKGKDRLIWYIGIKLRNPRQKLNFVQFCFAAFYEPTKAEELGKDIKNLLVALYDIYNVWSNNSGCSNNGTNGTQTSNIVQLSSQDVTFKVDPNDFLVSFRKLKERKLDIGMQNEIERYLLEPTTDPNNKNFDILSWWKLHGTEHQTLSQITRDILAILVFTVASDSAFST
ncbi:hypothetical protein Ddye_015981 [Dipteronia dyeriana]|uniref:HAT C-terminal dimerisation domain-containing protein n=1 Tax=Dipteronia dyeriana TaxID=168575 RepID=A0AAD9U6E4_9ROSI|nr:hypothetical protein Ddye_015981 [Dipteronia dyeriana]